MPRFLEPQYPFEWAGAYAAAGRAAHTDARRANMVMSTIMATTSMTMTIMGMMITGTITRMRR